MKDATWDGFRRWTCSVPELGFRIDLSRMGISAERWRDLGPRLDRALAAMTELEGGAIANPDEGRMVGHYWLRAPDRAPTEEIGEQIRTTRDAVFAFVERVHGGDVRPPSADRFRSFLVIGIGGSALGPQLVAEALGETSDRMKPHFFDNTDPDGFERTLARLDLAETLAIVISKSGGTPETRNGMFEAAAAWRAAGLAFGEHAVGVTQQGSKLDAYARDNGFLATFPMWDWVGGRTSETSAVGLLPGALQGIDMRRLLDGAAAMDQVTRRDDPRSNPAALLAAAWFHAGEGKGLRDMVILPYKDRLSLLSRYLQQLVMESLGKERDLDGKTVHQGIAVYGNKGSTDQHAYVQQLRDGLPNFFATFLQVLRDRDGATLEVGEGVTSGDFLLGFLLGTRQALYENGRPSVTLTIREVTPESLGMLVALYERAVGLYATMIHVNAYHQPGVEAGKRAAAEILDLQRALIAALGERGDAGATCVELAEAAGHPTRAEEAFWLLEHLAENPNRKIGWDPGPTVFDAVFRVIR